MVCYGHCVFYVQFLVFHVLVILFTKKKNQWVFFVIEQRHFSSSWRGLKKVRIL